MEHFSIACLQLNLPKGNNLEVLQNRIRATKQRFPWLDMLVLSELCIDGPATGFAETFPSYAIEQFCLLAKDLNIWLIPGSQFERAGEHVFNTATVINNQGDVVSTYRKVFPFTPYEEGVSAGSEFLVFDCPAGKVGLAICYDLWFPEVARTLVCEGAEVLIYPTLTGTIDRDLETSMAISTAAMNQAYVLTVNAAGLYGNGKSIVVDPQGKVVHLAGENEEIIPVEIDFGLVRRTRERGILTLGQPLKSFRDNQIHWQHLTPEHRQSSALQELGQLKKIK